MAGQLEVGNGGQVVVIEAHAVHFGVGAGTQPNHYVAHVDIVAYRAAGAHANDRLHAVIGNQLFGVNGHGRNTHAVAHDGNLAAFVGAGVAEHIAHVVHLAHVLQVSVGDVLGAQRVAGHQNGIGEIAFFGIDMGGSHGELL